MDKTMNASSAISHDGEVFIDFADFLKLMRAKTHLTQEEFSKKVGVKKQSVCLWENGHRFPVRSLKRISGFLRVPVREILKFKEIYKNRHFQKLVSNSRETVISRPEPVSVPLFGEAVGKFPLSAVKSPEIWKGERCVLPANLFPGSIFGFKIQDMAMEPDYCLGDIVLADIRKKPKNGDVVVVKLKDLSPICRIYQNWRDSVKILKPRDPRMLDIRAKKASVEWCFGVVRKLS